jgi:glycosyltransferase involved in cell wall biosynthesis
LEVHPEAVLLVKLVVSKKNSNMSISAIEDVTARFERPISLESTRIFFLFDYLSDEQMRALYAISDFYLCTSVAEGQNLPIIEAMAEGVLPVSTINTAMLDYLSSDNCVEIKTRKFSAFERETGADVARRSYAVAFCSQTDIGRALLRACRLPRAELDKLRLNAQRTVSQKFSLETVSALVSRRIEMIMAVAGCTRDRR